MNKKLIKKVAYILWDAAGINGDENDAYELILGHYNLKKDYEDLSKDNLDKLKTKLIITFSCYEDMVVHMTNNQAIRFSFKEARYIVNIILDFFNIKEKIHE